MKNSKLLLLSGSVAFSAVGSQAFADVALPALDTSDAADVATWAIAGITSYFLIKATPVIVMWGVGKISSYLGRG
ncbi:hypothetical protein LIN78_17825 [Leeia sp. TBRC 13508]|uniref:Uncharacterized protein n=1 Tax=Leeia speluncae TaxID=2884804 RepID=A0ABS8DB13_9NEIS|nr:hypothetical protein [Leeia speluncae]MCB6185409.1 hypothetical protein [Leeia speluncae]